MYLKEILHRSNDNSKIKQIRPVDWQKYDALRMLHLNPQSRQYDGFTPRRRVFGRTPKLPTGAAGNPNSCDFTNPEDSPSKQTLRALAKLRERIKIPFRKRFSRETQFNLKSSRSGHGKRRILLMANSLFLSKWEK